MAGGLDILIVGIAGKDSDDRLTAIAPSKRLEKLFGGYFQNDPGGIEHSNYVHKLEQDPTTTNPGIFYITGENEWGWVVGTGLGYVLFSGNNNASPKQLDERVFARIPELKELFMRELHSKGLQVRGYKVGVHAINVYDT